MEKTAEKKKLLTGNDKVEILNSIMERENLLCLVDFRKLHVTLDLVPIEKAPKKFELDFENRKWRDDSNSRWNKIGEHGGPSEVRLVFDSSNFEHLKYAFELAQNFQR